MHNVAKGIKKNNNCTHAHIGILLANLLITTIKELAILVADIFADHIIGTPLIRSTVKCDFLLACSCMLEVIFLIILLSRGH